MAPPRPTNHVTRAMDAQRSNSMRSPSQEWPEVSPRLVTFLEATYPPRCKEPGENLEAHMEYAGMVKLVGLLRTQADRLADFSHGEDDPDGAEDEAELVAQTRKD